MIWSTGFIVARGLLWHVAPGPVLFVRLSLTTVLLGGLAVWRREKLPLGTRLVRHLVAGMLLHGAYLCASWWAISRGMPAGIMALLGALQPLVTAVASFSFFRERLGARAWIGLATGFAGVTMVLMPVLTRVDHSTVAPLVAIVAILSIFAMAAGTMVQHGPIGEDPICVSGAVQNAGGSLVAVFTTILLGDYRWDGSAALWLGLLWSVFALSASALSLLVWMTRRQGATRVSALLLLVPPLAALEARLLFGETLSLVQLCGFALALSGVVMTRRKVSPHAYAQ